MVQRTVHVGRKTALRGILAALGAAAIMVWSPLADAQTACSPTSFDGGLVANGGFETGDFTGWTVTDPTPPSITIDSTDPYDGCFDASLGTEGQTGTLSQTLTTVADTTYNISFALQNLGIGFIIGAEESFTISFGGDVLLSYDSSSGDPLNVGFYGIESFSDLAASASTQLTITEENDDEAWLLDDVAVTPQAPAGVPEPASALILLTAIAAIAATRKRWQA